MIRISYFHMVIGLFVCACPLAAETGPGVVPGQLSVDGLQLDGLDIYESGHHCPLRQHSLSRQDHVGESPPFPLFFSTRVALSTWRQQTKRTRPTARTRPAPRASQTADRSAVSLRFSADWFRVIVRRKNSINDQIRQRKTCETWSNRRQQKNVFNCIRSRVRYWGCSSPRRPAAAFRDAESKYIQHSRDRPGY